MIVSLKRDGDDRPYSLSVANNPMNSTSIMTDRFGTYVLSIFDDDSRDNRPILSITYFNLPPKTLIRVPPPHELLPAFAVFTS